VAFEKYFCLLSIPLLLCATTEGQIVEGAGFDPEPVQLTSVRAEAGSHPITSMDLLNLRDIVGLSISPDGRLVAFVLQQAVYQNNGYRTGLFIVGTEAKSIPKPLGSAGMPHWDEINSVEQEAPQWSRDSKRIRMRTKWTAESTWQVWQWTVDSTGPPIQLTHIPGDVEDYQQSNDGNEMVLTVRPRPEPSPATTISEQGVLYDGDFQAWQALPISTEMREAHPPATEIWIHDDNSRQESRASKQEVSLLKPILTADDCKTRLNDNHKPGSSVVDQKVSPNQHMVAFRCYLGEGSGNNTHLFLRFVKSNRTTDLTPNTYYVEQYWWTSDNRKLLYTEYNGDGHRGQLDFISPDGGPPTEVSIPGRTFLSSFSFNSSGSVMAAIQETNTMPPQVALVDLGAGTIQTLVDVNPEFVNIQLSTPVRIGGVNKYGEPWFGHLVKPFNYFPGRRYPLIITTYRSGDWFLRGASGNENPIQVYAANGFMVLNFDVGRNPAVPPGDFGAALRIWSSPTKSIEDAVDRLCSAGLVDRRRVGIAGYSHGSEIMAYAISHTRLFSAAIGDAGGREPYFYYMADRNWQEIFRRWGLGGWPEGRMRKRWAAVSATLNANRINTPLLINAADSEFVADLALFTSLKQLHKPVELFIYSNELHVKNQPKHRYEIYTKNLDWFKFWLMGVKDPSGSKADQYQRWSKMKSRGGQTQPSQSSARRD
jgi:dipeptidyl aminopeptidase/acylaminoacyl peptidase